MEKETLFPEDPLSPKENDASEALPVPESITDLPTSIPASSMEVHHHAHHEHGKRSWKSYFWEFIMLFLAVFCGFLAEYALEHKIESDRELQFMKSMAQDLKSNTTLIKSNISHLKLRWAQADSLRKELLSGGHQTHGADVYFWGRMLSRRRQLFVSDGTLEQLKSSGGLRLIHNNKVVRMIMEYDGLYRNTLYQYGVDQELLNDYRKMAALVFDATVFQTVLPADDSPRPAGNPSLGNNTPQAVNELANKVTYLNGGLFRLIELVEELDKKGIELLSLIRAEYGLTE